MSRLPPCMGGWCLLRDFCKHYYRASGLRPAERLCAADEHDYWQPTVSMTVPRRTTEQTTTKETSNG